MCMERGLNKVKRKKFTACYNKEIPRFLYTQWNGFRVRKLFFFTRFLHVCKQFFFSGYLQLSYLSLEQILKRGGLSPAGTSASICANENGQSVPRNGSLGDMSFFFLKHDR